MRFERLRLRARQQIERAGCAGDALVGGRELDQVFDRIAARADGFALAGVYGEEPEQKCK
jgi:hypothetical protein